MSEIPIETTRHTVAKGTIEKSGRVQVACRFDETMFEAIHALAASRNVSFASQVRILLRDRLKQIKAGRETA